MPKSISDFMGDFRRKYTNFNYKNKTSHIKMFEKYFKAIYQYKQELIIIVQMGRVDR